MKDGYVYLTNLSVGDTVELTFDMPVRRIYANTRVRKDAGLVAVARGPVVYTLEEKDNGKQLYDLAIPGAAVFQTEKAEDDVIGSYVRITAGGFRFTSKDDSLYSEEEPEMEGVTLTFIPYYLWGNRGIGEMRVWVREA